MAVSTVRLALGEWIGAGVRYRRTGVTGRTPAVALGLGALTAALVTSYDLLLRPANVPADLEALLTAPVLFLFAVLIKLVLLFLAVVIAAGLFRPARIAEFSAKIFGVELNYTYANEVVDDAERSQERARRQMDLIGEVNRAVLAYLAGPFENALLKAENRADAVRQAVRDVLVDAYDSHRDCVRIHVVPLTPDGIGELGERLSALVHLSLEEDAEVVTIRRDVGIAVIHGEDDFGSVIAIEGRRGYGVSLAEICAASTLFVVAANAAGPLAS